MPRSRLTAAPVLATVLVSACFGTTPPSSFFVLSAAPPSARGEATAPPDRGRAGPTPAGAGAQGVLGVMPARVPAYLDRPQIVTFTGDNAVGVDEYARWAEPLSSGVSRVLAQDLAPRLPGWRVTTQSWDPSVPLRAQLVVDVDAMGWDTRGEARLEAGWEILSPAGTASLACGRTSLRRALPRPGHEAGVATLSALLDEMAREVGAAAAALPPP